MAKYPHKLGYSSTVDGNLAYDLENPALHPEYTINPPQIPELTRQKNRSRQKIAQRSPQIIAPGAVLGFAVAAILMVLTLMAQIKLTSISDETVKIQNALTELRTEESRLKIDYENALNLTEIEEYAINVLGMQKPNGDQIRYVNGAAPDKAFILKGQIQEDDGFFDRLEAFLVSAGEYFE